MDTDAEKATSHEEEKQQRNPKSAKANQSRLRLKATQATGVNSSKAMT